MVFGGWSVGALFAATFSIFQYVGLGRTPDLGQILSWQFATAAGWIILTPLIFYLTKSFPLGGVNFWRNLFLQITGGLGIVLTRQAIDAYVQPKLGFPGHLELTTYFESFKYLLVWDLHFSLATYCIALGIIFGTHYYQNFREREIETIQLKASLSEARMHVLKMQLNPHFLFNTHNTISALMHIDINMAQKMLANLSDLLRISLDKLDVEEVSLGQELDFLSKYLEIERTRFHDRLKVEYNIEPETLSAFVPNMILQPLLENALKHGISPLARGGTIKVCASKIGETLLLEISDDGIGIRNNNSSEIIQGIGLSNTKARLKYLYKNDFVFNIDSNVPTGLKIEIFIPFKNSTLKQNQNKNKESV